MDFAMTMVVMAAVSAALTMTGCAEPPAVDSGLGVALPSLEEGAARLVGAWRPQRGVPAYPVGLQLDDSGLCWMLLLDEEDPSGNELLGRCDWAYGGDVLTLQFEDGVGRGGGAHEATLVDERLQFGPIAGDCDQRTGLLVASPWVWEG